MSTYQINQTIERIQNDLKLLIGERLRVKANLGRCKIIETVGVLEEAHPKLFILSVNDGDQQRKFSYSYADLLTQTVELSQVKTSENLLPWLDS